MSPDENAVDPRLSSAVIFDDGVSPIIGLDPKTGKRYLRCVAFIFAGRECWREFYAPSGEVLLRVEWHPAYGSRIAKGSFEAVRAINPLHLPPETEEQIRLDLTSLPFNCMEGVPPTVMESTLELMHKANAPILAGV